jgi:hypothetical protein
MLNHGGHRVHRGLGGWGTSDSSLSAAAPPDMIEAGVAPFHGFLNTRSRPGWHYFSDGPYPPRHPRGPTYATTGCSGETRVKILELWD